MVLPTTLSWDGSAAKAGEIAIVTLHDLDGDLLIGVDAPFHGDPAPDAPVGATWRLWEHEVVECFLGSWEEGGVPAYLEVELSPHGHHLALRLRGVRTIVERELPLSFNAAIASNRWSGEARIPAAWLPVGPRTEWIVNATACHGTGFSRRYLTAARLRSDAPDFHRPHDWVAWI